LRRREDFIQAFKSPVSLRAPCRIGAYHRGQRSIEKQIDWTTDAEFEAITVYFEPPSEEEGFNVVRHERARQQGWSGPARPAAHPERSLVFRVNPYEEFLTL
jgi:hypothetical protein